ncbi:BTAD domain-containing putative transcriptional regulator [Nesterenkonia suensis]
MRIEVLGPLRLRSTTDDLVEVPERKVRALLAALVMDHDAAVAADTLIDRVWGTDLPAHPVRVLQAKLSQLRAVLDQACPGARALLSSGPGGHRLAAQTPEARISVDADLFTAAVAQARRTEDPAERAALLRDGLALWRGEPFAELRDAAWLAPTVQQLHEQRRQAVELLGAALLGLDRPQDAVAVLDPLFATEPMRAELTRTLMLALHRASRHPDALAVFERHRRHLAEELGADPDQQTTALHVRILQQDPALHRPASDSPGTAHPSATGPASPGLPRYASTFLGRAAALQELTQLLQQGPLVTVLGIGGVGKTRLAIRAAEEITAQQRSTAWFVDLTGLDPGPADTGTASDDPSGGASGGRSDGAGAAPGASPERIARAVAESVGITLARGDGSALLPHLISALQSLPGLLILDNCEHLVDDVAAFVDQVVSSGSSLTILATSREPLGLPGEQRLRLDPLPVRETDGEQADPDDAVAFFLHRAHALRPDLPDDADTRRTVAELCRRLDGLPLALELAAAQVGALDLPTLLTRLTDRLDLLRRPARGAPRRQQTLRGMLDWSWSLLDAPSQRLLRRLALHPASWTLETIEAICADDTSGPLRCSQVMPTVVGLVERSLVVAEPGSHGMRYRLLESVSAYAAERLHDSGERDMLALRHLRHWRIELACAEQQLFSAHAQDWIRRLHRERVHLTRAFGEAVERGRGADAVALAWSWFWHRWMTGSTAGLATELRLAVEAPGPRDLPHAQVGVLAEVLDGRTPDRPGRIRRALAAFDDVGGEDGEDGEDVNGQERDLARAQVQWFAATPVLISPAAREVGRRLADEAVELLLSSGDLPRAAFASTQRDWFLLDAGEEAIGMPDGHDAEQILRTAGDAYGLTQILGMRHIQAARDGDRTTALAAAREATALAQQLEAAGEESYWQTVHGLHSLDAGDLDSASAHLHRARQLGAQCGHRIETHFAELGLAELAARTGDADRAAELRTRASSRTARRWVHRVLEGNEPHRQARGSAGSAVADQPAEGQHTG